MFSALTDSTQRAWLVALLILWAFFLFGGFAAGSGDPGRRMPTWTRMASSATLVVAAWSWFAFARGTAAQSYALFIACGMTFGFLGDLFLAGLLPGGRNVLGGIAAFAAGHLFYIIAFLRFSSQTGLTDPGRRWPVLVAWLLVAVVGWFLVVYRGSAEHTVLHWAVLPYALLLATTAGLATGMALQDPRFAPLAVGGALFLLSDLILAGEMFGGLSFPLIGDVVWLTYGPAQALIVYSVAAALAR
jgi:hypothetical protein